jgi:hypothetical protein
MKQVFLLTAAVAVIALGAMAQDNAIAARTMAQLKVMGPNAMVMGPAVKGAPYSGEEVTQSDQVLGDGTHIHNQTSVKVYRDSEGRVRRESSESIRIMDPVTGTSYVLDPKTITARKMTFFFSSTNADGTVLTRTGGGRGGVLSGTVADTTITVTAGAVDAAARAEKLAAEKMTTDALKFAAESAANLTLTKKQLVGIADGEFASIVSDNDVTVKALGKKESLGTQILEGVPSEGTRTTSTIEVGAIGNDRALSIVAERWYSPDLKTVMMTSHSDPRSGTETFRLTNVLRTEPSASLFALPAEYKLVEGPTGPTVTVRPVER